MADAHDDTTWLIAREIPRLRRYALSLTDEPHLADDLVQDCVERAIRKQGQWRRQGSVRSWLYRILYRIFLDQGPERYRRRRALPLEAVAIPPAQPSVQETQTACKELVAGVMNLPPDQRAAIMLTVVEGCSYDEASTILDIPVGTLRSRLFRAREKLRAFQPESDARHMIRRVK